MGECKPTHCTDGEEVWIYRRSLRDGRVKVKFMCEEFLVQLVHLHTSLLL